MMRIKTKCKTCGKEVDGDSVLNGDCIQCQEEWIRRDEISWQSNFNSWEQKKKWYEKI